jgi:glutamine synthetase
LKISVEYIWIDGTSPTKKLRTKNQILKVDARQDKSKGKTFAELSRSMDQSELVLLYKDQDWWMDEHTSMSNIDYLKNLVIPAWGFDGSSTNQAKTSPSDRPLIPVCATINPLRDRSILVLCEVMDLDGKPHKTNTRHVVKQAVEKFKEHECLFGIEQEYNLFEAGTLADIPLGWPDRGPAPPQGKYYCGVGADEVHGYNINIEHEEACRDCGLSIRGTNAEVMPGQWEFQTDTSDPLTTADHLWLGRYLLYRIASRHSAVVKLDPKPLNGDWNGAGAHTNFSTKAMRAEAKEGDPLLESSQVGFAACEAACKKLGSRYKKDGFPSIYGDGYEARLVGALETCSHAEFKYDVADRGASIRIPLHVKTSGSGYIEDRRPCANIDPYEVVTYIMESVCGN